MSNLTGDQLIAAETAVNEENLRAFMGPRAEKYVLHWQLTDRGAQKLKISWHWPALFVPLPWMLFRKMYFAAAVAFLLPLIFNFLFPGNKLFGVGYFIVIAMGAKDLYLFHVKTKIKKIALRYADPLQRSDEIKRAGNVSWPLAIVGGGLMFAQFSYFILTFMEKVSARWS